jgi:polysaccharide biosynthesis protein PslJ
VSVTVENRSGARSTPGVEPSGGRRRGRPVAILQVYVVLLVLIPPTQIIGPLGAAGTPANVIGLVAFVLWGVAVLAPGDQLHRTVVPVRVVLGLLIGTILLGYTVLHSRYVPVDELLSSDRALLQVMSWAGVALLAAEGLRDLGELYHVLRTLTAAVAVMAIVGFLQFRFGTDLVELVVPNIPGLHQNADLVTIQDREGFRRPAGTATHPIEFGCVIAMALPLALHLARFDLARSRTRRWLPVAAIVMAIPVAVSRSAVLGAVVATAVIIVGLDPRLRPRALGAVAAFLVVTYATSPGLLGALRNLFLNAGSDTSITTRTQDYDDIAEYVQQSPWIGRGPGTFLPTNYIYLDNQYLVSAVEIGLVGLFVVIVYLLTTTFLGRGARHRTREPAIRDLGQAMAATGLAGAITAFTFDAFSFLMYAGFVPLCLGAAGGLWMMQRTAEGRIDTAPSLDAGWPDPPRESLPDRVRDAPTAGDRPAEDGRIRVLDEAPLAGAALSHHGGDVGQAEDGPYDADEGSQRLTTSDAEPLGIGAQSSGDQDDETQGSPRVVAAVGVGLGVVLLGASALVVGIGGGDEPEIAVSPNITTSTTMSTTTSAAEHTATARPSSTSTTATARPSSTTATARPSSATATTRPETTTTSRSRPTPSPSPPSQPTPLTNSTVPLSTTTVPSTPSTSTSTTTTSTTTTTTATTTTTTTPPA